jgi:DNA-binding PucR family transcriptional regulator
VALLKIMDWACEDEELAQGKLAKLLEHDREHGTSYRDTLRAYLDARGNTGLAATRLSIHPNTLRYRLERLIALSGLDLDDSDERLVTELQLRMR